MFGDACELRLVCPKELKLLSENARYFKKDIFDQLVNNIRSDGRMSSVPLCCIHNGKLEVLSGNHRVQAAIIAGIKLILVLVIIDNITEGRRVAIQISHNSLVGEDDKQILSDLWSKIDEIEYKCYAGLSSDTIEDIKKIKLVDFTTPVFRTKQVSFVFVEPDAAFIDDVMDELQHSPADTIYMADIKHFDVFFAAIKSIKKKHNIKNGSLAMLRLLESARGN